MCYAISGDVYSANVKLFATFHVEGNINLVCCSARLSGDGIGTIVSCIVATALSHFADIFTSSCFVILAPNPIAQLSSEGPAYRPYTWREFIVARMNDNYADLGAADTQISHFRIG